MAYDVEFTVEFSDWWDDLTIEEQRSVSYGVKLLEEYGVGLKRPFADTISGSKFQNMKELRIQHQGRPYRVLYAFDPRRVGLLLIAGDKTGNDRWYKEFVPKADAIFERHLQNLKCN